MVTSRVPPPTLASYAHNLGNINKIDAKTHMGFQSIKIMKQIRSKHSSPHNGGPMSLGHFFLIEISHFFLFGFISLKGQVTNS
jgi:hypothetical protein